MKHYHKNPRTISKKRFEKLRADLAEYGDLGGIVHDLNSGEVVGGNQRMEAIDLNKCQVEITHKLESPDAQGTVAHGYVIWKGNRYAYREVRWTPEICEKANLIANFDGGTWDGDILSGWDPELLTDIGFDKDYLAEIKTDLGWMSALVESQIPEAIDVEPEIDRAAELQEIWKTESGQLWKIGEHRLLIGDCTIREDVEKVMAGEKAVCMWTDPPYGVEYIGKTKDSLTIKNDNSEGISELLNKSFENINTILGEGSPIYIAHPPGVLQMVFNQCFVDAGWKFHETLVWVKDTMVMGHSDYHYKHEPIIYGWKGKNRFWYSGRSEVSVLECDRPKRSSDHPTMKPVELVNKCLINSTQNGDILVDPFGGSGTTMVACQNLERKCRMIEISPAYGAVILQRMATAFPELSIEQAQS